MKRFLSLALCILLAMSLLACGAAKMTDKQTLACDMADEVVTEWFDELGAEYASVKTERKMVGDTALYILHIKLEVEELNDELVSKFQDYIVDEAEMYVSPADVYVVAYFSNQYGEEDYRSVSNGIPQDVVSKLD